MDYIHNRKELKEHRRELRKNSTPQEEKLWGYLRNKGLGYKFRRQHSIGQFITDFYCTEKKLVIELDGNHHLQDGNLSYDQERSDFLRDLRCTTVRFKNSEIDKDILKVIEEIKNILSIL